MYFCRINYLLFFCPSALLFLISVKWVAKTVIRLWMISALNANFAA